MKRKYVYAIIFILAAASTYLIFFAQTTKTEAITPLGDAMYITCRAYCGATGGDLSWEIREAFLADCYGNCEYLKVF